MTVLDLLARRVQRDGARPFLTWYDLADSARTELSAISWANWVDKTANLLIDEYDLGPGDLVQLDVLAERPRHWMALVWAAACWRAGCLASVADTDSADLLVTGPNPPSDPDVPTLACSLHPLGLGLRDLPAGVADYATEARLQPDSFLGGPADPAAPAWRDADTELSLADLESPAIADRIEVTASDPFPVIAQAVLGPLAGGGSAILLEDTGNTDNAQLRRRVLADEKVATA